MASATDPRRFGLALLAAASAALLVWFGTGLNPHWPLLWFAPLPVLLLANRATWWGTALAAACAWLLGNLNMWHYQHSVIDIPPIALAGIYGGLTLLFTLSVLLYRALLRRGASWTALLSFPALYVSGEYLFNLRSPHGTSGSLAYSQLNFLPFLQVASLAGPWGMTFLLLLFPAAIAIGVHQRGARPEQARAVIGVSLGVIAAALAFGAARLGVHGPRRPVTVGLIASDPPASPPVADEGASTARLFQLYADRAAALVAQGAQIIVLPEKLGVAVDPDTATTDVMFQSLADTTRATIVVGLIHVAPPVKYNQTRVYAPSAAVQSYDKRHMLPAFEGKFIPGTTLTLIAGFSGTWGVAICKDMDFTPLSRQYGEAGVGLMLVPAWDFDVDRFWHGHLAIMRGVESGFSIVRSAKQGYLTVSDNRGRVIAENTSDAAPFATLLAAVPATHDNTVYLMLGDWFACVTLAIVAFALVQLLPFRWPKPARGLALI